MKGSGEIVDVDDEEFYDTVDHVGNAGDAQGIEKELTLLKKGFISCIIFGCTILCYH